MNHFQFQNIVLLIFSISYSATSPTIQPTMISTEVVDEECGCVCDEPDLPPSQQPALSPSPEPPLMSAPQAPASPSPQPPLMSAPQAPASPSPEPPLMSAPQAPVSSSPQPPLMSAPQAPASSSPEPPLMAAPEAPQSAPMTVPEPPLMTAPEAPASAPMAVPEPEVANEVVSAPSRGMALFPGSRLGPVTMMPQPAAAAPESDQFQEEESSFNLLPSRGLAPLVPASSVEEPQTEDTSENINGFSFGEETGIEFVETLPFETPFERKILCVKRNHLDDELVDILISSVRILNELGKVYLKFNDYVESKVKFEGELYDFVPDFDVSKLTLYDSSNYRKTRVEYRYFLSCNTLFVPINFHFRFGMININLNENINEDYFFRRKKTDLCNMTFENAEIDVYNSDYKCMFVAGENKAAINSLERELEHGNEQGQYNLYMKGRYFPRS